MKYLKVLKCSTLGILRDIHLFVVADSMPCLEDLDISHPQNNLRTYPRLKQGHPLIEQGQVEVTDRGIEVLSLKLKGLRKINISGNYSITDKSLFALSTNCVYLTDVDVCSCSSVTPKGVEFVMRNSPDLSRLSVGRIDFGQVDGYAICCARSVSTLEMESTNFSDDYLHLLANTGIPLRRLLLSFCGPFTFSGISSLLNKYQNLESLYLAGYEFLTDEKMSGLSQCIPALVGVTLDYCYNLTETTFFMLAKNCPLLQDISMKVTNLGGGQDRATNIVKNRRIKSLDLGPNSHLGDECLGKLASVCPNLEVLDVSTCENITEKGIADVLNSSSKIRKLRIKNCRGIKNIGNCFELSELEVLGAASSGIDDDGLKVIGNRCGRLRKLKLDFCLGVTTVGLKETLRNCKRLTMISLAGCDNVSMVSVDWMVFSSPSLRKIILPRSCLTSESQRKLFLQHGCVVLSSNY